MTLDSASLAPVPWGPWYPVSKRSTAIAAVGVFVTAVLVYASTLGHGFVWDDQTILLAHGDLGDWSRVAGTLTSNFFQESQEQGTFDYWRPAVVLSHMIEMTAFGQAAWGFHLINVLLHATASLLVVFLSLRWFNRNRVIGLLAGLLFAVHPAHVEVVAWVSGRSDVLLGLFLLLALVSDGCWSLTRKTRWLVTSLAAFGLALFSKEAAAVFPLLVVARAFLDTAKKLPVAARLLRAIRAGTPSLVVFGLYLWLRFAVVGVAPQTAGVALSDRLSLFWTWWSAFWVYTRLLVWPTSLSILHDLETVTSPNSAASIVGLTVFLALLWWGWRQRTPEPGVSYGVVVWLVCLAPASHFMLPLSSQGQAGFPVAERFLYAPSIGFCLVAGWLMGCWLPGWIGWVSSSGSGRNRANVEHRRLTYHTRVLYLLMGGIPFLVVLAGGLKSFSRSLDWKDEVSLFGAAVELLPGNGTVQLNYAAALGDLAEKEDDAVARRGLIEQAREHFLTALGLIPNNYRVHFGLGNLYRLAGDDERAKKCYQESLRLNPDLYQAMVNLGTLLAQRGDLQSALEMFEPVVRLRPRNANAKVNLAHVLQMTGRREEAAALYKAALQLEPDLEAAKKGLHRAEATMKITTGDGL